MTTIKNKPGRPKADRTKTATQAVADNVADDVTGAIARVAELERQNTDLLETIEQFERERLGEPMPTFVTGDFGFLPALPGPADNRFGHFADVFHASRYWPDLTPAQIAVLIAAGDSLGLEPAQSVFDLRIENGSIRWAPGQPFAAAKVAIDDAKYAAECVANGDARSGDPINPPTKVNAGGGVVVDGRFGNGETFSVDGPHIVDDHTGTRFDVSEIVDIARSAFANNGVLSVPAEKPAPEGPEPPETTSAGGPATSAAVIDAMSPTDFLNHLSAKADGDAATLNHVLAKSPDELFAGAETIADLGDAATAAIPQMAAAELERREKIAVLQSAIGDRPGKCVIRTETPDPASSSSETPLTALPADVGGAGDETLKVVQHWRASIQSRLTELCYSFEDIAKRLSKFDDAATTNKRDMYEQCEKFYSERTETERKKAIAALVADGKPSIDQQKGFFLFANVPVDPMDWTFKQAAQAARIACEPDAAA